jgi:hypothetical protein
MPDKETNQLRQFDTGATRNADASRYDPEGFLSPLVIERFSEYMNRNRVQADGNTRDSDNWQKGIPLPVYAKGLQRHHLHFWLRHRAWPVRDSGAASNIEDDLCAIIFNAQGYLHELLRASVSNDGMQQDAEPCNGFYTFTGNKSDHMPCALAMGHDGECLYRLPARFTDGQG